MVAVFDPLKVPLAPEAGGANVTATPGTGLPPESFTVATRGAANAPLITAVWPLPLVTTMLAAAPTVFVREKLAGLATPLTVAVTV